MDFKIYTFYEMALFSNDILRKLHFRGLTHRADYPDEELNHALLNSMFTMFCIETSGFGRGLGVLDVNKDSISKCYMLNPHLVSKKKIEKKL